MLGFFCRIVRLDIGAKIGLYSILLLLDASSLLERTFVERWSAGRRSPFHQRGARLRTARGGPDRKGSPKGPRKPLAPPALHPSFEGTEKGNHGTSVALPAGQRSVG